jgi:hypothetical protein
MKSLFSLSIILILVSCSPQKKLNRLIKKHPELIKVDTLHVHDTLITESVVKDTVLNWNTLHDTAFIYKDKLKIKIVRMNDSIFVQGECASDTIYRTIEVPFNYVQPIQKDKSNNSRFWIFILILIGIILLLFKFK